MFYTLRHRLSRLFTFAEIAGVVFVWSPVSVTIRVGVLTIRVGVFFDSEMSMTHHVSKTASACFYHIRRLYYARFVTLSAERS